MDDALWIDTVVNIADLMVAVCSVTINIVASFTLFQCKNIVSQIKILIYNLLLIQWIYSLWVILSRGIILYHGMMLFPYYCNAVIVGLAEIMGVSIGIVTCMAVDRMLAMYFVTWYTVRVTKETTVARCVTIWILMQCFAWIPFMREEESGNCVAGIFNNFKMEKLFLGILFFHCAFVTFICLLLVIRKIRNDRVIRPGNEVNTLAPNRFPLSFYHTPIVIFSLVVIVFFTCTPLAVSFLMSLFNKTPLNADNKLLIYAELYHIVFQLSYIVNTTVFVFVFKESRIYFIRTFCCCYPRLMLIADNLERKFSEENGILGPNPPVRLTSRVNQAREHVIRSLTDSDDDVAHVQDIDIFLIDPSNGHRQPALPDESTSSNAWC